ncbi:TetR/AcrR family transcriptional regulator [Paenibacillus macerans]|uniref:TetR/AcrR family transcriptional regulator n=1 Tax=Paenibacillus macerans TaxID=44252 RepID=UPI00203CE68F|nr:TetR/AcrR family transcriptional regulator [Paenibacillus macerans]MCM3699683.1 TetR/AcrR family transcriptional regulator [Paenibacillus macerans]
MVRYKKSEEKQKLVLYAAFQAVSELGFDSVTLQVIADYAKVSKGVVHYYFESKEAVLIELLKWLTAKIYEKECAAIKLEKSAANKLHAYIGSAFVSPEKNRTFYRVYLDFLAKASRNPVYREINQQFYDNCNAIGQEIIQLGQKEGIFAVNLSAEQTAPKIRAVIDGHLIQWLMIDRDDLHEFYREACLQTVMSMLNNFGGFEAKK